MNYFSGDPYVGSREEEFKRKNKRIEELELEVKRLKARNSELEAKYVFINNVTWSGLFSATLGRMATQDSGAVAEHQDLSREGRNRGSKSSLF